MKNLTIVALAMLLSLSSIAKAQKCTGNYLNAVENKLYDYRGNEVQITGVNWFGFETSMNYYHGLWTRDHKSMLQQIKDAGFNTIRIPWCNEIMRSQITDIRATGTDPVSGVSPMNEEESKVNTPLELLDITVEWCQRNDMKIILDNHSRNPDGYMVEELWYTKNVSHKQWIADWVTMAKRYKNNDAVIGMDINNEPHGAYGKGSRWGTGNPANDWRLAAQECGNAILKVNPHVLIFVEGVQEFENTGYWWGGNLVGAKKYPVVLSNPKKLVYSPHEYGPTVHPQKWFNAPDFPENMPAIWDKHFHYLHREKISPLMVGEFGIAHLGGLDEIWFKKFLEFMHVHGYSWTFWCWNPNSGDTGGILAPDWKTIVDWKMNMLRPYLAPAIANCGGIQLPIPVESITLSDESLELEKGQVYGLSATVLPEDANNKNIIWISSNPTVATVTSTGFITTLTEGEVVITATTEVGGLTASCALKVVASGSGTGNGCDLGIPMTTVLPKINGSYRHKTIYGVNPGIDNVTDFTINWDLQNNACYQLSFNTNDGKPNWWIDLRNFATLKFNQPYPEIIFNNTGFDALDGAHYIAVHEDNIVLKNQANGSIIYFSKTAQDPCAKSATQLNTENLVELFPNPATDELFIKNVSGASKVTIYSLMGQQIFEVNNPELNSNAITIKDWNRGTYVVQIQYINGEIESRKLILK
ncbi:MAG: cellulase family glycosylhydrolase [Bacteroidales bacterium]|nr:cellulase family glycosylhydrolase [Bacteroidales bacterium]